MAARGVALSGPTIGALLGASGGFPSAYFRDEKTAGTHGGSSVAATWTKRTAIQVYNDITGCSIASSVLTLPAGRFRMRARAPMFGSLGAVARFRDTTNSVSYEGGDAYSSNAVAVQVDNWVWCRTATLTAPANFELQHNVAFSTASTGFGVASSLGTIEIYAEWWVEKIN